MELETMLRQASSTRAIRIAIYDVGIVLGAILLADKAPNVLERAWNSPWKWDSTSDLATFVALIMWLGLIGTRFSEWRALSNLEKRIVECDDD
jgi:hypothetical protein